MGLVRVFIAAAFLCLQWKVSHAEKCLSGPYHLNTSRPSGSGFAACFNYKDNACCSDELTKVVKYKPESLYNFTWHHCKMVSKKCMEYLVNEECFYQCDPTLSRYQRAGRPDAVQRVPICSGYCDQWFNACSNDMTCAENWETGFAKIGSHYACPNTSKCLTFEKVYKNGAGLCNKMWGVSFYYQNANQTCYQMNGEKQKVGSNGCRIRLPLACMATSILLSILLGLFGN